MPKQVIDFDVVRGIGAALPEVKDASNLMGCALKLTGCLMACEAIHKSVEPNTLMVSIGIEPGNALIASDPDVYYLTSHYTRYPAILVRLSCPGTAQPAKGWASVRSLR